MADADKADGMQAEEEEEEDEEFMIRESEEGSAASPTHTATGLLLGEDAAACEGGPAEGLEETEAADDTLDGAADEGEGEGEGEDPNNLSRTAPLGDPPVPDAAEMLAAPQHTAGRSRSSSSPRKVSLCDSVRSTDDLLTTGVTGASSCSSLCDLNERGGGGRVAESTPLVKIPQIDLTPDRRSARQDRSATGSGASTPQPSDVQAVDRDEIIQELIRERDALLARVAEYERKEADMPSSMDFTTFDQKLEASLKPKTLTSDVQVNRLLDLEAFQDVLQNVMLVASGGDDHYFETIDSMSYPIHPAGRPKLHHIARQLLSLASSNFQTHQKMADEYRAAQERFEKRLERAVNDAFATPRRDDPEGVSSSFASDMSPGRIEIMSTPRDPLGGSAFAKTICRTPRQYIEYALTPRTSARSVTASSRSGSPTMEIQLATLSAVDTPRVLSEEDREQYSQPVQQLMRANELQGRLLTRELQEHIVTKNSLARLRDENAGLVAQLQDRECELLEKESLVALIREELHAGSNRIADLKLEVASVDRTEVLSLQREMKHVRDVLTAQQRQASDRERALMDEIDKMQRDLLSGLERLLAIEEAMTSTAVTTLHRSPVVLPSKPKSIWISTSRSPSPPQKVGFLASELRSLYAAIHRRGSGASQSLPPNV
eukprot:TRINITY_DN25452_c1_g2_i1.p1 TRINITY_DN25452_c1_g2~~TRINITY_DN25452_c1_g2_i1.p1  ORF type:complete len:683 (+),score=253.87 TRINITY_DN25452_c1_g2_i1:69-2051(+)